MTFRFIPYSSAPFSYHLLSLARSFSPQTKRRCYTPREVRSVVQASDAELRTGLDEHHVVLLDGALSHFLHRKGVTRQCGHRLAHGSLRLNLSPLLHALAGYLRQVSAVHLSQVLDALLTQIALSGQSPTRIRLDSTVHALHDDMDIMPEISRAALTRWFGKLVDGNERLAAEARPEAGADGTGAVQGAKGDFVCLDGKQIAKFVGLQLLREAKVSLSLSHWPAFQRTCIYAPCSDEFTPF